MKKFLKWLAAILAVGSVVGIVIAYLCKESKDEDEDFRFDCDDDDLTSTPICSRFPNEAMYL